MSDMNMRVLLGRGREFLERIRGPESTPHPPGTFGLLALRLERDLQRQGKGHSILVTGADDDAVGVEATVELGWCLAEDLGHTVLLVDGAFDVRTLSASLGVSERPGLSELLDGPEHDAAALRASLQPTMHERIFLLPHGNDPGERPIRAAAVRQLLAAACERFDFVLVHGSLLVKGNRSMAFSSMVDAALVIALEDRTTLEQVTRGRQLLNDCGASKVALVLANRPRPPRPSGR